MIHRLRRVISEPEQFRRLNGWLVLFWTAMFPLAVLLNLMSLVWFVALLSLYANWATHLGVWAASRAEVQAADSHLDDEREQRQIQREQAHDRRDHPL